MKPDQSVERGERCSEQGINRGFYLPRLPREYYQGDAVVHWTMSIAMRHEGWLDELFHAHFREIMLHAAEREFVLCPTYCLMPDHIHFVWMGLRLQTEQLNGVQFLRAHLGKMLQPHRFQHQAHDHVMRQEQRRKGVFSRVCFYIIDNSRRAGLVSHPKDWPFAGAIVPGYPALNPLDDSFWPWFWEHYQRERKPDCGEIKRPPIG